MDMAQTYGRTLLQILRNPEPEQVHCSNNAMTYLGIDPDSILVILVKPYYALRNNHPADITMFQRPMMGDDEGSSIWFDNIWSVEYRGVREDGIGAPEDMLVRRQIVSLLFRLRNVSECRWSSGG